jgi:lysophospholipase L1-like esterase
MSLVAGEILLRQLDLPRFDACSVTPDWAMPDPELGFAAPPGGSVAGYRLNERGLRGPVLSPAKPTGHLRILFIGDSTCWGLGVPLERSFAAVSTRLLVQDYPGQILEFLVGAFPGYSSYQSKIVLEHLLPMQPDLVVLYVGARNDSTRARYFPDSDIPRRRGRLRASWHQVRLLRSMEGLLDRSYRSLFRKLRSEVAGARVPPVDFRTNLTEMAEQLDRVGVTALIVVPPVSEAQAAHHPIVKQYRRMLEESALRHELAMVRLQPSFAGEDSAAVYFEDGYHLSEQGHRIAAEAIRTAVVEKGLLGQTRGSAAVVKSPAAP